MRDRESFKSVIASVGERFKTQKRTLEEERRGVFETAHYLEEKTASRLHELERELCDELQPLKASLKVYVNRSETDSRHWFWNQVVATAKALDYYADLRRFHRWVRLKIVEDRDVEILVSLHPVGTEFAGLMGASAFLEYRSRSADGETKIDGPFPLSDEVFLFSYKEDRLKVRGSYAKWLNRVLLKGLDEWRRHL